MNDHVIARQISIWSPVSQDYGTVLVHAKRCDGCNRKQDGQPGDFDTVEDAIAAIIAQIRTGRLTDADE